MPVLLTITTTHEPATDLGFLLHKHPERVQSFREPAGHAHVFYPEASPARCTAALLLEVDPVALVRGPATGGGGRGRGPGADGFTLGQYVNDRPYAASSLLAMALKDVFRTALTGRCDARPELADRPIPLEIHVPAVSTRGGAELVERLFGPLGWRVEARVAPLDETIPEWGESRCVDTRLTGELRLADALNHLYVLLPVLDDAKHYWVTDDEVDKLIRAGTGWLAAHPDRALITARYLAHRRTLTATALARLAEVDDTDAEEIDNAVPDNAVPDSVVPDSVVSGAAADTPDDTDPAPPVASEPMIDTGAEPGPVAEPAIPLGRARLEAVLAAVRAAAARTVGDFGCGEGTLVRALLADPALERVVAVDVSARAVGITGRRARIDRMTDAARARLSLFQSSLTYRDDRLAGLDAAVLMEVIEHVDPWRLPALEQAVFGHAAPRTVIVTTPNVEYNARYPTLPVGATRHRDHRFEWSRTEFRDWAAATGAAHGYTVRHLPVGAEDAEVGPPTQMAVFEKGRS